MSSRITYGRLGKKRALLQGAVKNSAATSSEEDPLDLLPPPTPSPTRPTKQRKITTNASPSKPQKKPGKPLRSNSTPSVASGSMLQAVQRTSRRLAKSPSADPLALPEMSPSPKLSSVKRKRTEFVPSVNDNIQTGIPRATKRTKVARTIVQDEEDIQLEVEYVPMSVVANATKSIAAQHQSRMNRSRSSLALNPALQKPVVNRNDAPDTKSPNPPRTPSPKPRRTSTVPMAKNPKNLSDVLDTQSPLGSQVDLTPGSSPSQAAEPTPRIPTPRRARMLGRSNTVPEIESLASGSHSGSRISSQASSVRTSSLIQKTISLPVFPSPSKSSGDPSSPLRDASGTSTPQAEAPPQPRPNLRTYSSSRSFLAPIPAPASPSAQAPLSDEESQELLQHESYADLRRKYRVDLSSDDDMETGIAGPIDLKSIGELRDKGENRRFMDDMGYLLEGLDQQMTIAVKRLSAIKLVDNMADLDYVRRAKTCDALGSAWDALDQANKPVADKIITLALVAFASLATRDPRHADELAKQASVGKLLAEQVSAPSLDDPLGFDTSSSRLEDAKRLAIGKPERLLISQIRSLLRKAELLENDDYLTSRRLSSQSLLSLRIHDTSSVSRILDSLLLETSSLTARVKTYSLGLPILPSQPEHSTPDLQHISNCLKILESALHSSNGDVVKEAFNDRRERLAADLIATCNLCASMDHDAEQDNAHDASECLIRLLRMLVKIVDNDPDWSIELASIPSAVSLLLRITSTYHHPKTKTKSKAKTTHKDRDILSQDSDVDVDAAAHTSANRLDIMCLALALLTSLVLDAGASTRSLVFQSKISPRCQFGRSCLKECQCPGAVGSIEVLVGMYVEETNKAKDSTSAESSFLTGHLAILLGLLCDDTKEKDMLSLLSYMPGPSASPAEKIATWTDAIQEFVGLYSDLTRRFADAIQQSASKDDGDNTMEDAEEEEDDSSVRENVDASTVPGVFASGETNGSQKGIELAEKVICLLREVADRL